MGVNSMGRRVPMIEGLRYRNVALTTATGATMDDFDPTLISTTKHQSFYFLPAIRYEGHQKVVGWNFNDTGTFDIRANTTGTTFSGTTGNVVRVATSGVGGAVFIARSTSQWMILGSGLTVVAATY